MAEARSLDSPIVGNKWKMRLIGSMEKLPTPRMRQGNTEPVVQSSFSTKEIRGLKAGAYRNRAATIDGLWPAASVGAMHTEVPAQAVIRVGVLVA